MKGRERTRSLLALGVLSAAFLTFAGKYAGRSVNNAWGDIALGGWAAAIGHRLAAGEHIYRDFTVPLPPGSFALLALVERTFGSGPRLLHEIWICALACLALSWLAYGIARRLAGRENALYVAAGTAAWVC